MAEKEQQFPEAQENAIQLIHNKLAWLARMGTSDELEADLDIEDGECVLPAGQAEIAAIVEQEIYPLEHWNVLDTWYEDKKMYTRRLQSTFVDVDGRSPYVEFLQKVSRRGNITHRIGWGWSDPFETEIAEAIIQLTPISIG